MAAQIAGDFQVGDQVIVEKYKGPYIPATRILIELISPDQSWPDKDFQIYMKQRLGKYFRLYLSVAKTRAYKN